MPQDPIQERLRRKQSVRRGRWILGLILVLLIPVLTYQAIHQLLFSNLVGIRRWLRLGLAIIMLRDCIATWLGNNDSRRFLSLLLLFLAAPWGLSSLMLTPIGITWLTGTANEDGGAVAAVLSRSVILLTILPFLFYAGTGATLLLSKSVRLFVSAQMRDRAKYRWLPDSLRAWLGRPDLVETVVEMRHDADRLVYPKLTQELIAALDEEELDDAVLDHVALKLEENEQAASNEVLRTLPVGVQAYYSLWWLRAEVENGGMYQFYVNKGPEMALMALQGCELLDLPELAAVLSQSLKICRNEIKELADIRHSLRLDELTADWAAKFASAEKASSMNELNELFYRAPQPDLHTLIRTRPELFEARTVRKETT